MNYKKSLLTFLGVIAFADISTAQVNVKSIVSHMERNGVLENKDGTVDIYTTSVRDTLNNNPVSYTLKLVNFAKIPDTYHLTLQITERNGLEEIIYSIEDA